jgi:hypothetical protein
LHFQGCAFRQWQLETRGAGAQAMQMEFETLYGSMADGHGLENAVAVCEPAIGRIHATIGGQDVPEAHGPVV